MVSHHFPTFFYCLLNLQTARNIQWGTETETCYLKGLDPGFNKKKWQSTICKSLLVILWQTNQHVRTYHDRLCTYRMSSDVKRPPPLPVIWKWLIFFKNADYFVLFCHPRQIGCFKKKRNMFIHKIVFICLFNKDGKLIILGTCFFQNMFWCNMLSAFQYLLAGKKWANSVF